MTRISTFSVLSGALAVFALSTNSASAGSVTIHSTTPQVKVHLPPSKVGGATILPRTGDEVLVGFEHGDTKQPYVLGKMNNGLSPAVRARGTLHR